MIKKNKNKKLKLSNSGLSPTNSITTYNHLNEKINSKVAGELPLTIKINGKEIITLMTLGTRPEELTLGYLRNQGLVDDIQEIASVNVKWDIGISDVVTMDKDTQDISKKLKNILLLVKKELSFDKNLNSDFDLKENLIIKNNKSKFIYTGCQIMNKKVLSDYKDKNFSITNVWNDLIEKKELYGFETNNNFYHLTDLETFKKLQDL